MLKSDVIVLILKKSIKRDEERFFIQMKGVGDREISKVTHLYKTNNFSKYMKLQLRKL